jgi:hypothetical protein
MGKCVAGLCDFNACATDADCASGEVCSCAAETPAQSGGIVCVSRPQDNVCVPGNCHVDADCGVGFFCSPSYGLTLQDGFYCHTCKDSCVNDEDCPGNDLQGFVCAFDPSAGAWGCRLGPCAE